MITKDKLKNLIEPHFEKDLVKENYKIYIKKAKELLTHTRLDLAFKLFYLDMKDKNKKLAEDIYLEHIRALTLGKFIEPGNSKKIGKEKFIAEFNKIFEDIKKNGFNSKRTLIPLSKNESIANGAHRVASAIYLNKNVECVKIDTANHIYDYKFFYNRKVSFDILDLVTLKFIEYAENVHIAFLWPIGEKREKEIENIIPNIVYKKSIKLNANGAHNLIAEIYSGEKWLGNRKDNFKGADGKVVKCFKTFDKFDIYVFQAKNLDEVLKVKEKIRKIFNMGKHSIHITDTKEEALKVSRLIFNDNGIHFLNYAKPNRYLSTYNDLNRFKKFIQKNEINVEDIVLDGGIVLSIYGLRKSSDIDYLIENNKIKFKEDNIESHNEIIKYHQEKKEDLIYNPKFNFYYNDLKFISFNQLYRMKKNRFDAEKNPKDLNDCKIMEALIEENKYKELINKFKQNFYYFKVKIRYFLINILEFIGLLETVRKILKKENK